MRRIADLEKKVAGLENRRSFRLRLFIRITINPGHDIFDRAEAGGEHFIREEGESDHEFRDRIMSVTDANPITMYPQSHESEFIAQRERNAKQLIAQHRNVSPSESGREMPDPNPYTQGDRESRLEAPFGARRRGLLGD